MIFIKNTSPQLNHLPVQIENDQSEAKRHRQDEDDRGREPLLMPPNPHRFPPGFPPGAPEPHNPLPPHAPPLFLPPLGLPLPPDKSPVFPGMIDPRPLYMQVGFFLKSFLCLTRLCCSGQRHSSRCQALSCPGCSRRTPAISR